MELHELTSLITSNFMVGVNKRKEFIEEFDHTDTQKHTKYHDAMVVGIHILNEDTIAINVDINK